MTSSIFSPRRLLALCSPSTQVRASATLLLPQPLGPTMAVTPSVEGELGSIGEGLETGNFESFEAHDCSAVWVEPRGQSNKPLPLWQGGRQTPIY